MAFKNAQQTRALVGQVAFAGYIRHLSLPQTVEMLEVSTLADTAHIYIPGQDTSTLALDMVLDTDTSTNGQWDRITAWKSSADLPVSIAPNGFAALSECLLINAQETSFTPTSAIAATVDVSLAAQTDGFTDAGYALENLGAVTTTTTGTARDLTAASTNGGVAHLHVTAYSALTSDVVTIEHSADGSTSWATLVTFTTVTGVTSERIVVSVGTNIRRYLRVVDTVTGAGSTTRQVSFARR